MKSARRLLPGLLVPAALAAALAAAAPPHSAPARGPERVPYPDPDEGAASLEKRKEAQLAAANEIRAFHDFQFRDRISESGITFVHRIVDDAGKSYKAVHYDHGNGIAVADSEH